MQNRVSAPNSGIFSGYRAIVLPTLLFAYILNFVDRQIIGILAVPIKADLRLSDTQLGMMGGLAFAIFYSTLGIPIAWLADRFSRKWIETIALTVWSGFTALCGMATGFTSLFVARLGVGIGEAGGVAPAFSMIADYYPPEQRARALSILTLGLPIGSALGLFVGGFLAAEYGWRFAFIALGAAGLVFAPLFAILVREPERGRFDPPPAPALGGKHPRGMLRAVITKPTFLLVALGSATASMLSYGLGFWLPSFIARSHGLDLSSTSNFLGTITITGGIAGILLGGYLTDHFGKRDRRAYVRIPAIAFLIGFPFLMAGVYVESLPLTFVLLLIPQAMGYIWTGPSVSIIQNIAPASIRATVSAVYLLIVNFIGLGIGTMVFGLLSDALTATYGDNALRMAIMICAVFLYPLTATLYFAATRQISKDWQD